ncbi:MAG TPA: CRISPR-associated protein Csx18 [Candidatus Obscuribacterales bacterium]
MPISLARLLVRYRILSVAIANAGITWIILIIAPLGLFAVITCTLTVFMGSLIVTTLGDRALDHLLHLEGEQLRQTDLTPNPGTSPFQSDRHLSNPQRREISDR